MDNGHLELGGTSNICRFVKICEQPSCSLRIAFPSQKDEDDWHKLELFRRVLLRIVEGEEWLLIDGPEEASAIALAVEACENDTFPDEVGKGCRIRIPEGARLRPDSVVNSKKDVVTAVSATGAGDRWLRYLRSAFSPTRG